VTFFDIKKPNLAAIQTSFTGRLYSVDMFALYRAVSGRYPTYPSVVAGGVGLSIQQDVITFGGAFGPFGRFHWVGDVYSAIYNDQIERDVRPLGVVGELFWPAWTAYTQLLRDDADEVGEPFRAPLLPHFDTSLPKLELDPSGLDVPGRFIYGVYRGDVDSMEVLLRMLLQYMPETAITIPIFKRDLDGMFGLYAEWARERFLGQTASPGARILSKVILLADYRWYLLLGDLLSLIEPTFRQTAFSDGISRLGTMMRVEAERIVLA
jgi:hypothetical protein